eukprot:1159947-Pelagomonas_calceolata.AAC.9
MLALGPVSQQQPIGKVSFDLISVIRQASLLLLGIMQKVLLGSMHREISRTPHPHLLAAGQRAALFKHLLSAPLTGSTFVCVKCTAAA